MDHQGKTVGRVDCQGESFRTGDEPVGILELSTSRHRCYLDTVDLSAPCYTVPPDPERVFQPAPVFEDIGLSVANVASEVEGDLRQAWHPLDSGGGSDRLRANR